MTQIQLSDQELESLLHEQLEFLKASSTSFDSGFEGEIKRLAVSVRVMVHDTQSSTSLLTLLNIKAILFTDTAIPYNNENILSHSSLVRVHLTPQGGIPKPHLDDSPIKSNVPFDKWWNGIVLVDQAKTEYSRKDIVLFLANKEGGAHVDPSLDTKYVDLRKNNALGWVETLEDGRQIQGADHVPATMRQIAHELIKSIDPNYSCTQQPVPGTSIIFQGVSVTRGTGIPEGIVGNLRKDRPIIYGNKVGRNDLCPCGSGKKYKKCCL